MPTKELVNDPKATDDVATSKFDELITSTGSREEATFKPFIEALKRLDFKTPEEV